MSGNPLKKLAGQTAIYGLPTIGGRMLNYALVPFFTYIFGKPADFGLNVEFFAYISFLNILFTYGMETALFNFSVAEKDKNMVYSTTLRSLVVSTFALSIPFIFFSDDLARLLRYPGHADFIWWMILIVGTDAVAAIPFAKLRQENKAKRFASIKMINISVNVIVNLFFIGACKYYFEKNPDSMLGSLYNPTIGIGYSFIAQLVANVISLILLSPEIARIRYGFDFAMWKRMMQYSLPLLIVGFGGMVNETMDRILIKYLLPKGIAETQVGIYGACYKISILMTLFVMAFRYAAEPFFFARQSEKDAPSLYGKVMTYFVIFCLLIFLGTTLNISWIQYFVGKEYRSGLPVVPILLLANLFLGMYFNLSIWFKLTGKTRYGMFITIIGAIITLFLNFAWIPSSNAYVGGYMGSAWATLICYCSMMILSYFIGQKYYRVDYAVKRVLAYLAFAIGLFFIGKYIDSQLNVLDLKFVMKNKLVVDIHTRVFNLNLLLKNGLILLYLIVILFVEKPLKMMRKPAMEKIQNT